MEMEHQDFTESESNMDYPEDIVEWFDAHMEPIEVDVKKEEGEKAGREFFGSNEREKAETVKNDKGETEQENGKDAVCTIRKIDDYLTQEKIDEDELDETEISNSIKFVCPTCKSSLPILGEGVSTTLKNCGHTVCRRCVETALQNVIEYRTREMRCFFPFYKYSYRCNAEIEEHEIRNLVDPDIYEKYLEVTLDQIKKEAGNRVFNCKTYKCRGWCIVEDDNVTSFLCPACKVDNYVNLKEDQEVKEVVNDVDKYIQTERYDEMMSLLQNAIIPNFEAFECPICFVDCQPQEGLTLKNCLHTFCKECIAQTVLHSEEVDVKCPYKDEISLCNETIQQSEIKAVVKPEDFQKYLQRSITVAEMKAGKCAFHCKTPDCPGWCIYEDGVDYFLCPVCERNNCFLCKKIHNGTDCVPETAASVDDMSEQLIKELLIAKSAILCPKCKAVIIKTYGCDSIHCSACKTEICWATRGPRWGPNGRGDTSGGCKCSPLRKCHPSCHNCH